MQTNPFNTSAPTPAPKTNPFDTTTIGKVVNFYKAIPGAIKDTAADLFHGITRSLEGAGRTLLGQDDLPAPTTSDPKAYQAFHSFMYGNEPVPNLQNRVATSEQTIKANPIAKKTGADKFALPLAFGGVMGDVALNLTPFGGEGNVLKNLLKETTAHGAHTILTKIGIADDVARAFAPHFAESRTPEEVQHTYDLLKHAQSAKVAADDLAAKAATKAAGKNAFDAEPAKIQAAAPVSPELSPAPIPPEAHTDWEQNIRPKFYEAHDEVQRIRSSLENAKGSLRETQLSRQLDKALARQMKPVDAWFQKWGIEPKDPAMQDSLFKTDALPASTSERPLSAVERLRATRAAMPERTPPIPKTVGEYLSTREPVRRPSEISGTSREPFPRGSQSSHEFDGAGRAFEQSIQHNPKAYAKKVHILDYIKTPEYVLEKMGLGREAKIVRGAFEGYQKELPVEIDRITKWHDSLKANPESNTRVFKWLDGQSINLTKHEGEVAHEIKQYLRGWADRLDLPYDNRVSHYITHIFEHDFINKEFDPDLAKLIEGKVPGSVYDPFLEKRLGAMGYKEDTFAALDAYVKRATRKAHMDPALEALEHAASKLDLESYKYIQRYASRVNMRPTETENLLDNLVKNFVGYKFGQRPVAYLSRTGRQIVYRGTLGLNIGSALRNLTQGVNTYAKLGEKYTIVGYSKLVTRLMTNDLKELYESNVLTENLLQDRTIGVYKKNIQRLDKGLFAFFELAEKINRGSAYFGAKAKGLANGKTEADAIEYAKRIVRETQFSFSSIDTPVAMNDDVVKLLTQLQSFNIKQVEFLGGMAKNKEWAGLVRWIGGSLTMVYSVGKLIGMKPTDIIPTVRLGGAPIPSTVGAGFNYATARTDQDKAAAKKQLTGNVFAFIPGGVQAHKTFQGAVALSKGKTTTPTGKTRFKVGNDIGTALRALMFGPNNLPQAQNYFDSIGKKKTTAVGANPFDN